MVVFALNEINQEFYVTLEEIMDEIPFKVVLMPGNPKEFKVYSYYINRLGLELISSTEHFSNKRILLLGESERFFLSTLSKDEFRKSLNTILALQPPLLIISRSITPSKVLIEVASEHKVPILSTELAAPDITDILAPFLNVKLAPRITRAGGLMNVHGEGIFIVGESGVGKSETAIELLKRGHKLVADDLVEIRKIQKSKLMGSAPKNVRHFVEMRGVGIINARKVFGIGSIKLSENIDMVVNLEKWDDNKPYNRIGIEYVTTEILGVRVPYITVPVCPGRNLAVIIEVAAMANRQRKMGYSAARELFSGMGMEFPDTLQEEKVEKCIWDI